MPESPNGLGLDLSAMASKGHAETKTRVKGGLGQRKAALASMYAEAQAGRASNLASLDRRNAFARAQSLADDALARRQMAAREAAAAAERRQEILERQALEKAEALREKRAAADWYDQQEFQTDQNIRQQVEVAKQLKALETDETEGLLPDLSEFGGSTISSLRGASLNEHQPGRFKVTAAELEAARAAYEAETPQEADRLLREAFKQKDGTGYRSRTASLALYQLFGPDGPEGPL